MAGPMRSRRLLLMPTVSAFSIATVIFSLQVLGLLSGLVRALAARSGGTARAGPCFREAGRALPILSANRDISTRCGAICFRPSDPIRRGEGGGLVFPSTPMLA